MWTARDVTLRLRAELGDERLVVRFAPLVNGGRWVAYVRRKVLTGARSWPVKILDDGSVEPGGPSTIREVEAFDDLVHVLETPEGEYQSLDPNLFRHALVERDSHRRDVARELFQAIAERRERRERRFREEIRDRSLYYRRAFARIADDMGLGNHPDYSRVYNPTRISPA